MNQNTFIVYFSKFESKTKYSNRQRSIINENATEGTLLNLNITFEGADVIFLTLAGVSKLTLKYFERNNYELNSFFSAP